MKKNIVLMILLVFILASCSDKVNLNSNSNNINQDSNNINQEKINNELNIENEEIKVGKKIDNIKQNNDFEAKASGGTTDFIAFNINSSNFEENNSKIDGVLNSNNLNKNKVQIILEANNHVYSYEDIDYLKNITLSGINPEKYKIIETKMGGHHIIVLLDFGLGTKIDTLEFKNSPVGDISLVFNK